MAGRYSLGSSRPSSHRLAQASTARQDLADVILFATLGGIGIVLWFVWNLVIFGSPTAFLSGSFSSQAQTEAFIQRVATPIIISGRPFAITRSRRRNPSKLAVRAGSARRSTLPDPSTLLKRGAGRLHDSYSVRVLLRGILLGPGCHVRPTRHPSALLHVQRPLWRRDGGDCRSISIQSILDIFFQLAQPIIAETGYVCSYSPGRHVSNREVGHLDT